MLVAAAESYHTYSENSNVCTEDDAKLCLIDHRNLLHWAQYKALEDSYTDIACDNEEYAETSVTMQARECPEFKTELKQFQIVETKMFKGHCGYKSGTNNDFKDLAECGAEKLKKCLKAKGDKAKEYFDKEERFTDKQSCCYLKMIESCSTDGETCANGKQPKDYIGDENGMYTLEICANKGYTDVDEKCGQSGGQSDGQSGSTKLFSSSQYLVIVVCIIIISFINKQRGF